MFALFASLFFAGASQAGSLGQLPPGLVQQGNVVHFDGRYDARRVEIDGRRAVALVEQSTGKLVITLGCKGCSPWCGSVQEITGPNAGKVVCRSSRACPEGSPCKITEIAVVVPDGDVEAGAR